MSALGADELFDRLAEEFVAHRRGGGDPSISEFASRHPEIADDIRLLFPLLGTMEEIVPPKHETMHADTELGDYTLLREIGRGGMGVVYEAMQRTLGRRVALKILPAHTTLDSRYLERFRTEAQAAGRLQHPNIVPVIGYGEHDGIHYYTMQYVEGRGLDDVIDALREGRGDDPIVARLLHADVSTSTTASASAPAVAPAVRSTGVDTVRRRRYYENCARVALQAAEGVAAAHAHGVLHRDIKPSNLLVQPSGRVWITDFGLCKEVGEGNITGSGDILGSLRYMPPERLEGESDVQGDVYGLGVTLYELLTLQPAYPEEDRLTLLRQLAGDDEPRPPRALDPRVPSDLEAITLKAMARDRSQRYATADAMASELRAFLEGRPIAARPPTLGYFLRTAARRHRPLAVTVLLATVLLMASTVFYVLSLRTKEAATRFQSYVAHIAAAEAAIKGGDMQAGQRLLALAPKELRNWEWHHLWSQLDRSLRTIHVSDGPLYGIAYNPSGDRFVVADAGALYVHETAGATRIATCELEGHAVTVRWSPDGKWIAVATHDGVELWGWPAAERARRFETGTAVRGLSFSRDGARLAAGGEDGRARVWRVESGELETQFHVRSRILAVDFHPAGGRLAVGSGDGLATVWDLETNAPVWSRTCSESGVHGIAYVGRDLVATPTERTHTTIWRAGDGRFVGALSRPRRLHTAVVRASPDGRYLAVNHRWGTQLWHVPTWRHLVTWPDDVAAQGVAFHPAGTRIATVSRIGRVREWALSPQGDPDVLLGHIDDVISVAIAPSGRFLVSGGRGGVVRKWDARTGKQQRAWIGHKWAVTSVLVAPDERVVAAADLLGEVILRDVASDAILHRIQAHDNGALALAFLPGGRLASTGGDGSLRIWARSTGTLEREVAVSDTRVAALAVSPDGRQLAAGTRDGAIRLFDATTLRALATLEGHTGEVNGLDYAPTGRRLASASDDQSVRVWDLDEGTAVHVMRAASHRSPEFSLLSVVFSADGTRLATSCRDGTVRLWATESGLLVATVADHDAYAYQAAFSPDGTQLISATGDARIEIWHTKPLRERHAAAEQEAAVQARGVALAASRSNEDPETVIAALRADDTLDESTREAALQEVHRRWGTQEGLIAHLWRAVTPHTMDVHARWAARGLAADLHRAALHRNRRDSRRGSLWGALTVRTGDYELAVERLEKARAMNEDRAPDLLAMDLAFLTMAFAAMERPTEARETHRRLRDVLRTHGIDDPRLLGFEAEARDALDRRKQPAAGGR